VTDVVFLKPLFRHYLEGAMKNSKNLRMTYFVQAFERDITQTPVKRQTASMKSVRSSLVSIDRRECLKMLVAEDTILSYF
jgi:hypothetical protein